MDFVSANISSRGPKAAEIRTPLDPEAQEVGIFCFRWVLQSFGVAWLFPMEVGLGYPIKRWIMS